MTAPTQKRGEKGKKRELPYLLFDLSDQALARRRGGKRK